MEEGQEFRVSKYNSGVAIIIRLDGLWKDTHRHSRAGQYYKWNGDLDRIWCELSRDLPNDEYDDKKDEHGNVKQEGYKSQFDKFDAKILECGEIKDNIFDSFDNPKPQDVENRKKQYKVLMDKELFLRRLENHIGKGTAWDEDNEGFD